MRLRWRVWKGGGYGLVLLWVGGFREVGAWGFELVVSSSRGVRGGAPPPGGLWSG